MQLRFKSLSRLHSVGFAILVLQGLTACETMLPITRQSEAVFEPLPTAVETHVFKVQDEQSSLGINAHVPANPNDTLSDLARHFGLGFDEIQMANPGVDPWVLNDKQGIILPLQYLLPEAPKKGIVINLANMRLFFYPPKQAGTVVTYPIGIGRDGWNTPLGKTTVISKRYKPDWTAPKSILEEHRLLNEPLPKVIRSGPDNPLGLYAMNLGFKGYLIHGTNKPYGIGMQVSHGCIQMYPEDIELLFSQVDLNTPVNIVHQPYMLGFKDRVLYVEAHPALEKWKSQQKSQRQNLYKRLKIAATNYHLNLDWQKIEQALKQADGVPIAVSLPEPAVTKIALEHPAVLKAQPIVEAILDNRRWYLSVDEEMDEYPAKKLTAMLNHQGPAIPVRSLPKQKKFAVIAGPFQSRQEANHVKARIKKTFDLKSELIVPN
ncbi:MAG: hypothetical protein RLZ92_703 [Pseudomonadota bacterium]|jgi:L,D-transpeptidase ErfK/SrfK